MKRIVLFSSVCLALVFATSAMALPATSTHESPIFTNPVHGMHELGDFSQDFSKTRSDTLDFIGGWENTGAMLTLTHDGVAVPRYWSGKFQDQAGSPHWQGWHQPRMWTFGSVIPERPGYDFTFVPSHFWSVTDDNGSGNPGNVPLVIEGTKSLWLGVYAPEDWATPEGSPGYGSAWNQSIRFVFDLPPGTGDVEVNWNYWIYWDNEDFPYDPMRAQYNTNIGWEDVAEYHGAPAVIDQAEFESYAFPLTAAEHEGRVQLRFIFQSDGSWDDQDGFHATRRGALQLDDIEVTITDAATSNVLAYSFEDFEGLPVTAPGVALSFGDWDVVVATGVGNYAALYDILTVSADVLCQFNTSPMVCFVNSGQYNVIDPGVVTVPPRFGQDHQYGPNGNIVEHSGGMLGIDGELWSGVTSPVVSLDQGGFNADILHFWFDTFRHGSLDADSDWIFYRFHLRSTDSDDWQDVYNATWSSSGFYYGGPDFIRSGFAVSTWPIPGAKYVQIGLSACQFQQSGENGRPQPYFDNIRFYAIEASGPAIGSDFVNMAQDKFPVDMNLTDLSHPGNRVKFDRAWDINPRTQDGIRFGDSLTIGVTPLRGGYEHHPVKTPRAYFAIKANPLFLAYRDYSLVPGIDNIAFNDGIYTFDVALNQVLGAGGVPVPNSYWLDIDGDDFNNPLPVFFPGDIMHYYIEGWDFNPVTLDEGATTWPAILDYFGLFEAEYIPEDTTPAPAETGRYPSTHTVHALPSISEVGGQIVWPEILWINAFWNRGGENEWRNALANSGFHPSGSLEPGAVTPQYYDMFYVNRPDNLGGNHIGGIANLKDIEGYSTILYTSGNLSTHVMGSGEWGTNNYPNKATCHQLLTSWFGLGGKNALFTGNDLASANTQSSAGLTFNTNILGVNFVSNSIRSQIAGQVAPLVRPLPGNSVFDNSRAWVAYGSCPVIHTFDNVQPRDPSIERLAGFGAPGQTPATWTDSYAPMAASLYHTWTPVGLGPNQVVYMPYDLMYIRNYPGYTSATVPHTSERSLVLRDVLQKFGQMSTNYTGVTPDAVLAVSNYPNPFNPATTIKLSLPRTGEVSLKVYNVRGELVRTLVSGTLEAGAHDIVWDGTNDRGAQASSGIYFYETRTGGEVKVGKMALVK